jgi:hypothetical protein
MDKRPPKVKEPSMSSDNPDRQARLTEALRANLRRRKAQAREQTPSDQEPREQEPADRSSSTE